MKPIDLGNLHLSLEPEHQAGVQESWAVVEDGTLEHCPTGIQIGELGIRDGRTVFVVDPNDIEVDQAHILGRGAGGIVARGRHKPSKMVLAVKVVRLEEQAKRSQLINELNNLLRIAKSEFLIQLYAAYVQKDTGCVHVALEYMDFGSLADVRQRKSVVPEYILALILVQILEGLKILHLCNVVHRDVKLGNILVNSRGCVKVTDFGISKRLEDNDVCDTFVGTATHMSPERVLGKDYSFAADIWSLGLCVFELASGTYPFSSVGSFPVLFDNLCNKPVPKLLPPRFSPELCEFVEIQLQRLPSHRATAIQLQAHDFISMWLLKSTEGDLAAWLRSTMAR